MTLAPRVYIRGSLVNELAAPNGLQGAVSVRSSTRVPATQIRGFAPVGPHDPPGTPKERQEENQMTLANDTTRIIRAPLDRRIMPIRSRWSSLMADETLAVDDLDTLELMLQSMRWELNERRKQP